MLEISVKGQNRTDMGKKASKLMRKEGLVPCNLYGEKRDENGLPVAKAFTVSFAELRKVVYTPNIYVINLDIEGEKHIAILKELQFHPVTEKLVSLTGCECLVAQTGSIVLSDAMTCTREAYALPDLLLVYATTDQIVPGMRTAFQTVKRKYAKNKPSQITIITGPSRSTDIEQTLVIGANGIRQVAVFLVDEE